MRGLLLALSVLSFAQIPAMDEGNPHSYDDQTNLETDLYGLFFPETYRNDQTDWFEQSNESFLCSFPDQINHTGCISEENVHHQLPSTPLPPAVQLIESNENLTCNSCNNETGAPVATITQSIEHSTPASRMINCEKVQGTIPLLIKKLRQGTLPEDLFEQVAFAYKLPSLKQLGGALTKHISDGTISEDQFNAFATYHSQCNWDGLSDETIKYIERLYVMQYSQVKNKTRKRACQRLPYQIVMRPIKKQAARNTRNNFTAFEKANVRVCKTLIKEGNYCDDMFNILAQKSSMRGGLLTLDTLLQIALHAYKHLGKQALQGVIDHLKRNPLRDNMQESLIPILQAPSAGQASGYTPESESDEEYDSAD